MIDDHALKALAEVDPEVACFIAKGIAYVHSSKFVLELPESQIKTKRKWPGQVLTDISVSGQQKPVFKLPAWRDLLPKKVGYLKVSVMRETAPNGTECVQLMSLTTDDARWMQLGYYEFFQEQLDDPSFRIMTLPVVEDELSGIGIFQGDRLVGAVGAYNGLLKDEE